MLSQTKLLSCLLKADVERESFKSVGSRFHARSAATENALSPIFRLVLWMTGLPLDERKDERKGASDAACVNNFVT